MSKSEWTLETLYDHLTLAIKEADRRYEERFAAQEKAILKAEAASEKRHDATNEFRGQLRDQADTFLRADEANIKFAAIEQRLAAVEQEGNKGEGRSTITNNIWATMISIITAVVVASLISFFGK